MMTQILQSQTTAFGGTNQTKAKPGSQPKTAEELDNCFYSDVVTSRSPSPRETIAVCDRENHEMREMPKNSDQDECPWTPVQWRQAHSLDSALRESVQNTSKVQNDKLDDLWQMPDGIKEMHPKDKGKGIDPCEWGAVELDDEEMDPEMQKHILQNYSKKQKRKGLPEEVVTFDLPRMSRHKSVALSGHAKPIKYKRTGSTPASQIVPDSSLGGGSWGKLQ